ncbi:hypothetical protein GCK32_012294 [Trichostrongylus colubriformis]|uniref:Uncharacterized protein n=1 Tax=Trichostrongylus colubriformis TaxID=6319 RepID=A0AAN8EWN8_TRICO
MRTDEVKDEAEAEVPEQQSTDAATEPEPNAEVVPPERGSETEEQGEMSPILLPNFYHLIFQKAEQKEKEKRQRERLRSLELQRDKLHKAAWNMHIVVMVDVP